MSTAFDFASTYIDLAGADGAAPIEVTPSFWADLGSGARSLGGRLMGSYTMEGAAGHAEMHPHGEEVLFVASGRLEVIFEDEAGDRSSFVEAGEALVVPRGAWHRQVGHGPTTVVFVTAGQGTRHRASPEAVDAAPGA